ncbi:putative F-box/LRR-repeat protein At5g02930 [Solanum verrucosum]|uniref:putative F-box/LRR-repeat protein At5g02930 n=1 Tax=Solanum verrucosum TaxID=315347 RepID=UPI0020D19FB9|nr:putative F-box/LRR-repeat protein At5g02930 [Solanum verrucosum]
MTPDAKRVVGGGEREDRISKLPGNVMNRIVELLPVEDAAKTSILSKKWRYIWARLPNLWLNRAFWIYCTTQQIFRERVNTILLQHLGDIEKFHLVESVRSSLYAHTDRWLVYVTRKGVKELCLYMPDNRTYKVPSCVLNCPTLTNLELFKCLFKPPKSFVAFHHLINLRLQRITFVPTTEFYVIDCPLLVNLALVDCRGTQYLNIIVSSQLEHLVVHGCPYLDLNPFMNCKGLRKLQLEIDKVLDCNPNPKQDERSTLEKLLLSVATTLEFLHMGLSCLELLTADTISKCSPFASLQKLSLGIDLSKLHQTTCSLQLIKSCPNLSILQISVCASGDNAEAVLKYLDRPITCLDLRLNNLKYVVINCYECSKTELFFTKLLFACVPSLERMYIEQKKAIDSREESKIIKKLMCFLRASPSIFRIRKLRTTTYTSYIME